MTEPTETYASSQGEINISSILSSLPTETSNVIFLESTKKCLELMPSCQISEIEKKLFRWIMPPLKAIVVKTLDENFLVADTCDDDFIADEIRGNLRFVCSLIEILKDILEFLLKHSKINIGEVKSMVVNSIQIISSTFDHCKKSSESYKKNFNLDLLEIFKLAEAAHSLFLKLFESRVKIEESFENGEETKILLEVLDHLCDTSDIFIGLNNKLLTINWKGYLMILEKFSKVLKNEIKLKRPIGDLSARIKYNFISLINSDHPDIPVTYSIKLSEFFLKVVLKIFDIFWEYKRRLLEDMILFCCEMCSFGSHVFAMKDCPSEIITFLEETIFPHIKSFMNRFVQDKLFIEAMTDEKLLSEKCSSGFLYLLNVCLECVIITEGPNIVELDILVRRIFDCTKFCFEQFLCSESLFDNLVVNICGCVLFHDCYEKIELILLENILQEHIWNYFLASEVWCLLLRNASLQFHADTLKNLIKIENSLEFRKNSHRLEEVYLKHLIQRLFRMLPNDLKSQIFQFAYRTGNVWMKLDFQFIPALQNNVTEDVYQLTLNKIDEMGTDKFNFKDLIVLVENLELLSTINFQNMSVDPLNLVNEIEGIWELTFTDTSNNLFRYFIAKVFKITSSLTKEFNNKQLYTVLNRLMQLSTENYFNVQILLMLFSFCSINPTRLGQDGYKILRLIPKIITNQLRNSNNLIVKQIALDLLDVCAQNGKPSVIKDVIMGFNEMQLIICDYLQKRIAPMKFDEEYFKSIGSFEYKHNCVEWKHLEFANISKSFKPNDFDKNNKIVVDSPLPQNRKYSFKSNDNIEQQDSLKADNSEKESVKYSLKEFRYKPYKKRKKNSEEETKTESDETVAEVLIRLKGEVKCLMNILKTEKMTQKNVSDLKIITTQLSSLI